MGQVSGNVTLGNVILRTVEKTTPLTVAEYNGFARPGELIIDPNTFPPTLLVGDRNGQLNSIAGGNTTVINNINSNTITSNTINSTIINSNTINSNTISSNTFNSNYANITNLTSNGNVNFSNSSNVTLGDVGNLHISGGNPWDFLQTDGAGNLSWNTPDRIANGASNVSIPTAGGNIKVYNNMDVAGISNLGPNSNVVITGGVAGEFLQTNGSGSLRWASPAPIGWASQATIIGSTGIAPTKGTTAFDIMRYRKVGDKIYQVQIHYYGITGGTGGTGIYLWTLPGGLQFDTSVQWTNTNVTVGSLQTLDQWNARVIGSVGHMVTPTNPSAQGAYAYDATRFCLVTMGGAGAAQYGAFQNALYYGLNAAPLWIELDFIFTATT